LADLGIENMEVSMLKSMRVSLLKSSNSGIERMARSFTRTSNGLPSIYVPSQALEFCRSSRIGCSLGSEVIFVTVDEAGVYCFDGRSGKQKQVLQENIDLLPFEDILERVEKQ
jgi:hypothetical protein